jgi:hypothetical protein
VSESPLSTHAGPIAVIAGGLFAVAHVGQFVVMDRSNLLTMTLDPAFRLFSAAYAITFPLLLIALVALYWREAQEAGVFGAVAFCIAVTGTVGLPLVAWRYRLKEVGGGRDATKVRSGVQRGRGSDCPRDREADR